MVPNATLDRLRDRHAEWALWLAVVQHILTRTEATDWDAAVPASPGAPRPLTPLLAGATIAVSPSLVDRLARELIETAAISGTPAMATLVNVIHGKLEALNLFKAALCQQNAWIVQLAEAYEADSGALQAVSALVPLPFLHACRRRWASSLPESWLEGYCPLCGAWPSFSEVRGIERSRHHRCGRCGGGWHARVLSCAYCGTTDHDQLVSLVPEKGGPGIVEACARCTGYVKTFTRLQGCPPAEVILEDLASVELDIAAVDQGYARPTGSAHPLDVTVIEAERQP